MTPTEQRVHDAVTDSYEKHIWLEVPMRCSCGFHPKHNVGSLGADLMFQHISGAIADAAVAALGGAS